MDVADLFRTSTPTYQTVQCLLRRLYAKKKTADSYCGKETQMKWNKGGDLWCHDVCIVDDP
jgi:hypothetical protein